MKDEMLDNLYGSFELKERRGLGGMTFKYVSSNDVIDRMTRLFSGCWSTIVMSQEKVEDSVLVRVRVMVYDKETDKSYEHEGYGSGKIMRYTSGDKKGEVIDVGNAYKSAESKAIKNACSRWGVGLYLEETEDVLPTSDIESPAPVVEEEVPATPVPDFIPPTEETVEKDKDVSESPPFPPFNIPTPGQNTEESQEETVPELPPTEEKKSDISVSNKQDADLKISDVQKVALKSLLKLKELNFTELVVEALGGKGGTLPSSIEDLSYQQAVTIIKFGNDMVKK